MMASGSYRIRSIDVERDATTKRRLIHVRLHRSRPVSESFDEIFYRTLINRVSILAEPNATDEQIHDITTNSADATLEAFKANLVERLTRQQPKMIREHRRYARGFERRLRRYWGDALDRFYAIAVCAEESGSYFNTAHRPNAAATNDFVFDALSGLHARACRTAFEVHQLLTSGFPMAALARCRTLHELAVTAAVLSEYGRKPEFSDLAERYILHDAVLNWKDAVEYQKHCHSLGYDAFEAGELTEIKRQRDAVVARFGRQFAEDNGWAAEVTGKIRPGFVDLEKLADLSRLRGYYKWASHEVHADSKGWRLNHGERGSTSYMSTGHVNFGLSEPGQLAMGSLNLCTVTFLTCIHPASPEMLVRMTAIHHLIDAAQDSFVEGERLVSEAEDLLQHRINTGTR
jgi:hypothetical protein